MAEFDETETEAPRRATRLVFLLGMLLALFGGGAGFYASWSGMILGSEPATHAAERTQGVEDLAFVPMEPMVISLSPRAKKQYLRFRGELEVPSARRKEVTTLLPRVIDVLNSYLRALDESDLEDPAALARLRAQMLRRVQIVAGPGKVNDLLVMEFVLN